jgi:hypothetical protein
MLLQILKDYGELISITLIPFIIWFLGNHFQNRKMKRQAKEKLFLTLMAGRKATATKEYTDALNQIDVIFQDSKSVRIAWQQFYYSLSPKSQHFDSQNSFRLDMLSEMANDLGYKNLKQTEIDRFYIPQVFEDQRRGQELLLLENLRVLNYSKSYGVPFSPEEYKENYERLYKQPLSGASE